MKDEKEVKISNFDFKQLECWKAARELAEMAFEVCENEQWKFNFEIKSQLKRAALSAMNNIAEGYSRYYKKEFVRFPDMVQGSASEIISMTYICQDLDYLDLATIAELRVNAEKTQNLTLGMIKYLVRKYNLFN